MGLGSNRVPIWNTEQLNKVTKLSEINPRNTIQNKQLAKRLYRSAPKGSGLFQTNLIEPVPNFVRAPCEKTIEGKNNTFIVFGRHRPGHIASGYGARGATQAGCIDIVVGRMASSRPGPKDGMHVNNSFFADAARIYISQMTDIDTNFRLAEGEIGSKKGSSGIGIKADGIRIIGREGIKIVTGRTYVEGTGGDGERSSKNSKLLQAPGIELIAGNNTEMQQNCCNWSVPGPHGTEWVASLQPIPLGWNVRDCLIELSARLDELLSIVWNFMAKQLQYNLTNNVDLMRPWMPSAGTAITITELIAAFAPEMAIRGSLATWELNYLTDIGYKFVCSRNVRTT